MGWMNLTQYGDSWRAVVNAAMSFRIL